ncbi:hypothetical protein ACFWHT_11605 [Microbacterium sp. NPDC058342]|uniref:hypothetical protein n=1 Tax=Microbacterium sp. NPDC058342 TaxID=3346454 RepID=UPI0036558522
MNAVPPAAPTRARVPVWARRTFDMIPTPWLITGGTGALLAFTAAFGGLDTVPAPPAPELAVGDEFTGSDLSITVVGVEITDTRRGSGVFPDQDKGERVLTIFVDVTNEYSRPRPVSTSLTHSPVVDGITVEGLSTGKPSIARADDSTSAVVLQPDVTAPLIVSWTVPGDAVRAGDEVRITLPDSTRVVGESVVRGEFWTDVVVGARVTAHVHEGVAPE